MVHQSASLAAYLKGPLLPTSQLIIATYQLQVNDMLSSAEHRRAKGCFTLQHAV